MSNTNDFKPEQRVEATKAAVVTERTQAAVESTKLLSNADSLPVLHQGEVQNPGDPIQPLALTDQGTEVPETEHLLHHAGHHGGGRHRGHHDAGDAVVASGDTPPDKASLAAEALLDPAMMLTLAKDNPGLAAQLASQNPGLATELAKENPGLAMQLASQNPALAAQLAAQNPAMAAQLAAQGLIPPPLKIEA